VYANGYLFEEFLVETLLTAALALSSFLSQVFELGFAHDGTGRAKVGAKLLHGGGAFEYSFGSLSTIHAINVRLTSCWLLDDRVMLYSTCTVYAIVYRSNNTVL
jgi:hypothetical protein